MKKILFLLIFSVPFLCLGQHNVEASKMYPWKSPEKKVQQNVLSVTLFEGEAYDMKYLQLSANALMPSNKKTTLQVPDDEEQLLIVKTGTLGISFKDSTWSIGGGSIALLMPGEKYAVQNSTKDSCTYYVMKYRSKLPKDMARGNASGGSFVKDWNKIIFKPHDRGGVRSYFDHPTAMAKRFEMHVTTLKEGILSHAAHTHSAEEIVLIIDNKTEMQIGDKFYKGHNGDFYYIGSNISHAVRNDGRGTCTYFAFQFE